MNRVKDERGYWREDGVLVHRQVWEDEFGKLPRGWIVHHCDMVKTNNELYNLVGLPAPYHDQIHLAHFKNGTPLPTRRELLEVYHSKRAELEDLLPKWRELYGEFKSMEQRLRVLGVDPMKLTKKTKAEKAKKKKSGRSGSEWVQYHTNKAKSAPKVVRRTVNDTFADKARVAEIKALRDMEAKADQVRRKAGRKHGR